MGNKNRLPDVLNKEQLVKLFETIDNPKLGIASFVAFFCGLRINEVCQLKVEDIDLEKCRLKVVDSKNPRRNITGYGKDRYVDFPPEIRGPIRKWLEIIEGGKWLIPSLISPDRPLRKKTLHEHFRYALQKADLLVPLYSKNYKTTNRGRKIEVNRTRYKYYFHTLRHSYATYVYEKTSDLYAVSSLLGHSQITTTEIYARISGVKKKCTVAKAFRSLGDNFIEEQHLPPVEKIEVPVYYAQAEQLVRKAASKIPVALELLDLRLARQEISVDEYQSIKNAIMQKYIVVGQPADGD
jgi:integrase